MGQYWLPVSLDKREFINPHQLGAGLKLWEQIANHPGTGAALLVLCAAMPEVRGGGDLDLTENWHGPERKAAGPGPMPDHYPAVARRTIGRWAGDRIALVGDYTKRDDLPESHEADLIYNLCGTEEERLDRVGRCREVADLSNGRGVELCAYWLDRADRLSKAALYRDISADVARVLEHELCGSFTGDDWREWEPADADPVKIGPTRKER